jgi:hypothetical protein
MQTARDGEDLERLIRHGERLAAFPEDATASSIHTRRNIEHPTPNIERSARQCRVGSWMLDAVQIKDLYKVLEEGRGVL